MNNTKFERFVAKKIRIDDLNRGKYIKEENELSSNYILLSNNDKVSRVNIIGLNVLELPDSFILDDGNAQIPIRPFNQEFQNHKLGSLLCVIGKVREYNNTKYVIPEIIKELNNILWKQVRELELKYLSIISNACVDKGIHDIRAEENISKNQKIIVEEIKDNNVEDNIFDMIYSLIPTLDKGDGVTIEELKKHIKREDCEKIIYRLIEEGEVFEIKPGKIKIL